MSSPEIVNIIEMTPMQEGILFHSLMDEESGAYFEQVNLTLEGRMDPEVFEKSFNKLLERHDVLRTVFIAKDVDQPLQIVLKERKATLYYQDIASLSEEEQAEEIRNYLERDKSRSFQLEKDVLIRLALLKLGETKYAMILSYHHIIMDGWCLSILGKELFQIYAALVRGVPPQLEEVYPYSDYLEWLGSQNKEEAVAYWTGYLTEYEQQASIPSSAGAGKAAGYDYKTYTFKLPIDLTSALEKLASRQGVTLSTVVHALWGVILQRYNHSDDVVFGSVVSGRPPEVPGIENMVGIFINTVPMRVKNTSGKTFGGLLQEMHHAVIEANRYNYVSLADIQKNTPLKNNLIHHILVFENYPMDDETIGEENGIRITGTEMIQYTNYDFDITVFPQAELEFVFTYNGRLYGEAFIRRMEGHIRQGAQAVTEHEDPELSGIDILTAEETKRILNGFNKDAVEYPWDRTVHQWVEHHAEQDPERIALIYGEERISYGELNRLGNRLAKRFILEGLQPGDFAAVMLERSPLMVAAILGIWKAGAAYVPMDVEYPTDRKTAITGDSAARLILTLSRYDSSAFEHLYPERVLHLDGYGFRDGALAAEAAGSDDTAPAVQVQIEDAAYALFTSGSTGKPKGVVIEHKSMLNHIWAEKDFLGLTDEMVFAQNAHHCFDISVWQFFGALTLGGTTVIYPDEIVLQPHVLLQKLAADGVTLLEVVPSYLTVVMDVLEMQPAALEGLGSLKHVFITGEAGSTSLVKRWFELCPAIPMVNAYGPAEAADDISQELMERAPEEGEPVSIGRPLPNIRMYITDASMNLCPVGVPGEISVAGIAVGRGYLNDPVRTGQSFGTDPFSPVPGQRLYKTGDLGRWLPDGRIEFLGRKDHQVKIRGFRIELGEIENALAACEAVRQNAVVALENGRSSAYLCAYFTATGTSPVSAQELKDFLAERVPAYMIPMHFIQLDELPLNPSGKVDRKRLPEPEAVSTEPYVPPRNDLEQALALIWKEVLDTEEAGIHDDFFDRGGHSLKAILFVSKIYSELGMEASVKDIFTYPTIALLAGRFAGSSPAEMEAIPAAQIREGYPLSAAQRRLFILHELEGNSSTAYNMPIVYQVSGRLDVHKLEDKLRQIIARHEIYRSSFITVEGEPIQIVHDEAEFSITQRELQEDFDGDIRSVTASFIRPFDLGEAPLLRAEAIRTPEGNHWLLLDMHHIISDGISGQLLLKELTALYEGKELPAPSIAYKDYAVWQEDRFAGNAMKEQEAYWLNVFGGTELPVLQLPLDFKRPPVQSFEGRTIRFTAGEALTRQVNETAAGTKATLFAVLLAAYQVLLMKYSGQNDIVVGSPVAGRTHPQLQDAMGMFVSTVALRAYPCREKTFRELVKEVSGSVLAAMENQEYPFEKLVDQLNVVRDTSRNPLFDTMFSLFDPEEQPVKLGGMQLEPYPFASTAAKFDLMLDAGEEDGRLIFDLQYCTALFREDTAERMAGHYLNLLRELTLHPDKPLGEVEVVTPGERRHIVEIFNGRKGDYDFTRTVHERFEETAASTPSKTALLYEEEAIAYGELNVSANRIARYLRRIGLGEEDVAAVLLERTPQFVAGVLGIWKAQGAYVPMDPSHGVKRQKDILLDSGAKVLLTLSSHLEEEVTESFEGMIVCLDKIVQQLEAEEAEDLGLASDMNRLAYILFTSGSTGRPKGVMIEHLGMLNHILAEAEELELDSGLIFAQNANQCFDISVWQFFGALALGGTTAIYPKELVLEVSKFAGRIARDGVTLLEVVPTYLAMLMDALESGDNPLRSLRHLIITGESVKPGTAERWFKLCPGIPLVNAYGPAEASDDVSQYMMTSAPAGMPVVPVGRPVPNMNLYVVNEDMQLCPVGVVGELCVAGIGVGRGYLNDPEKTSRAFGEDPFRPGEGFRLYRTGDLGRWLPDGNLEFAGRSDFQVKVRGFRIELEEIESALQKHPLVKEAVVMARDDSAGDKYLCAYLTVKAGFDPKSLKEALQDELPDYMIPGHLVELAALPLLENGKVDRKSLPEPVRDPAADKEYTAAASETEQCLVDIWEEVLGTSPIGTQHNFFELGGDSIKAIQISSKLNARGYVMRIKDLFQNPHIVKLAKHVHKASREIDQGIVEGEVLLTPIQRWFFDQRFTNGHHYNQGVVLFKKDRFDLAALKEAWTKIVEHHDALRMVFRLKAEGVSSRDGGDDKDIRGSSSSLVKQINRAADGELFHLTIADFQGEVDPGEQISAAINELQASIDLENGPLVKLGVFRTSEGDHFAMVIHHLVIDGVSWRILFEDLTTAYTQAIQNQRIELPAKTDSYLNWAQGLSEYAKGREMKRENDYWSRLDAVKAKPLPRFSSGQSLKNRDNRTYTFRLPKEETDQLLAGAHTAYGTEINDLLMTGLGMTVQQWTGEDQVFICLEGHGREEIMREMNVSRTVGWFTSTYPVLLDMGNSEDLGYVIKQTKENLRQIPSKGIGYGIRKYLASSSSAVSEPEIKFNYLGQFDTDINTDVFQASPISQGQTVSPEADREIPLDIGGVIEEGELVLFIEYNLNEYTEASMAEFAELFQQSLSAVIAHCSSKDSKEMTPSDVGGGDLSIDELEAIMSFYES
ncbi:non-ribosomal peptide synthetase [Paenibacillus sp. FJAT-26967]|uniref:non-ribosomal peptide synthetase n=1 Tax=Paenibacillus sp. FJAT-26967 TaxID=1729690 RepID=UPI0008380152|nr:non-ribosomal peptide synthetase [Paenibacillus sp. FJAT-26967]